MNVFLNDRKGTRQISQIKIVEQNKRKALYYWVVRTWNCPENYSKHAFVPENYQCITICSRHVGCSLFTELISLSIKMPCQSPKMFLSDEEWRCQNNSGDLLGQIKFFCWKIGLRKQYAFRAGVILPNDVSDFCGLVEILTLLTLF